MEGIRVRYPADINFYKNMFDLKVIESVLAQLEEERGIPRQKVLEAIGAALASAYKKEHGKRGQIIEAEFDLATGGINFVQVKIVVDDTRVKTDDDDTDEDDERVKFNPEHHIMLQDARKIKKDAELDQKISFPLETKEGYSRIAAQTAKQVIIQKIREAEKESVSKEFGQREGEIVTGTVQRMERGNLYVDLGRATGVLPYEEQIRGEKFRQGERIRAYLYNVEETPRGIFLRLSRSHPKFLEALFHQEVPEIANEVVKIKAIAREPGSRSKIAVDSNDEHIDPVGSCVGQRGVRVSTVTSELGGEKIDVIEWFEDPERFIEVALSPAKILSVEINEDEHQAHVTVSEDQQSLAIGKGGQNVRLAHKLTGWKIDIRSIGGETVGNGRGEVEKEETEEQEEIQEEVVEEKTDTTEKEKEN